ncbi:hypothetical protein Poly51_48690 [Rubripirellula tenax]|uniref:Uncharacterized protein n=1 Tax=Rubripirellula tenax TaxID=2528015 RepID=A0A5C6EKG6_9BACT|nr:hypothetical protein [Rubripirellula tenax]TWU48965.1 hypothetical protein Poly51_48690 [Rubripirellula tenax]
MSFVYYALAPAPRPIHTLHENAELLYAPLNFLFENRITRGPLAWYADEWAAYGINPSFDPPGVDDSDYDDAMNAYLTAEQSEQH